MLKLVTNVGVVCLEVVTVVLAFSYAESPGITFWDNSKYFRSRTYSEQPCKRFSVFTAYLYVLQVLCGVGLISGVFGVSN